MSHGQCFESWLLGKYITRSLPSDCQMLRIQYSHFREEKSTFGTPSSASAVPRRRNGASHQESSPWSVSPIICAGPAPLSFSISLLCLQTCIPAHPQGFPEIQRENTNGGLCSPGVLRQLLGEGVLGLGVLELKQDNVVCFLGLGNGLPHRSDWLRLVTWPHPTAGRLESGVFLSQVPEFLVMSVAGRRKGN